MAYIPAARDPIIEIHRGAVPDFTIDRKFGRNTDIRSGTVPEDLWGGGGLYTGQPLGGSAETVDVFSSDSTDNASGVGAREVTITGLGSDYSLQTEILALHASDGTTAVTTSNTWFRVFRVAVSDAGSSNTNAGSITARHTTTTANVFAVIPVGAGSTVVAAISVPLGKVMIMKNLIISVNGGSNSGADIQATLRLTDIETQVARTVGYYVAVREDSSPIDFGYGFSIPEKTDVLIRVDNASSSQATSVSAEFNYMFAPKAS